MDIPNITGSQKRVVIVGAGFAGLTLAKNLSTRYFQVVLLDKNNYHQFQPLLYQVATAGLEPSSICFPLRKVFHKKKNVFIRIAEVQKVLSDQNKIETNIGTIGYDYLVLANGAETNFFDNKDMQHYGYSMKSVAEALLIRNTLLQNYEKALVTNNEKERNALLNIVIVGGGPTGVELAGAIAEMKHRFLPKDYPELNFSGMQIYLLEAAPNLLRGLSISSADKVSSYLKNLGVIVQNNTSVQKYDGHTVSLSNGASLESRCLIWAAGIKGVALAGLSGDMVLPNKRLKVDVYNRLQDCNNIFAIGDIACMQTECYPKGHPQVAPVAIQQAQLLSHNLERTAIRQQWVPFVYKDKGSMATVGRNLAVAELGKVKFKGFVAWLIWMFVHLISVIGIKNRLFILINWVWQYITYDQSLRLIIKPSEKNHKALHHESKKLVVAPASSPVSGVQ